MSENKEQHNKITAQHSFEQIAVEEWDTVVFKNQCGSVLMVHAWERAIEKELPFVAYQHFRYKNTHLVRLACINGRYTTTPFSDGSDVVPLSETPLNLAEFQTDARAMFGEDVRLRINARITPVIHANDFNTTAYDYEVSLTEPLLPRVRKTLRHTLSHPIEGEIKPSKEVSAIDAAYQLYLRHMRSVKNFALPKSLFRSLISEHGGELWTWSRDMKPEAIAIFIPSSTEVLYSLSAASSTALKAQAPHHLVYVALEHYRSQGIKSASLGATGKGSSLEVFKRGWRGEQYEIYEVSAASKKIGRTSSIRSLVKYVPLALYPLLTSKVGKYLF